MKVNAVYEKGVFNPSEKVDIPEHQKLVLHYWPEIKNDLDLEKAYAEASYSRSDLESRICSHFLKQGPYLLTRKNPSK